MAYYTLAESGLTLAGLKVKGDELPRKSNSNPAYFLVSQVTVAQLACHPDDCTPLTVLHEKYLLHKASS